MHLQCVRPPVGDEASVGFAAPRTLLISVPAYARHYQCERRPLPLAPEAPHHRQDDLQHRCFPPPQLMSSLLNLMLLLAELVVLPSLSHLVVELVHRWSGVVVLVWLVLVGARLVEVVVECEGLRIGTLLPRRCVMGGPGPSRPCSRDTASVSA